MTIQKMLVDNSLTFATSRVSIYSQINARNDINGTDASTLPQKLLLLDISEIKTMMIAELNTLRM